MVDRPAEYVAETELLGLCSPLAFFGEDQGLLGFFYGDFSEALKPGMGLDGNPFDFREPLPKRGEKERLLLFFGVRGFDGELPLFFARE